MPSRLRLYTGFEESNLQTLDDCPETLDECPAENCVAMTFGELAQIVAHAAKTRRTWLKDFAEEDVQVSNDLYEILTAYSRLRPGA